MVKIVGTHNGTFHADDVVAYVILEELFGPINLIRSRDDNDLRNCDIVFDVGGGKYDHHTNMKEYRENHIPYAAAGLIWRDFGKELLSKKGFPRESVDDVHTYIDEQYIQGLDAIDNGVRFTREVLVPELSSDIHRFNPKWNKEEEENEQFYKAVQFAKISFLNLLEEQLSVLAAEEIIVASFKKRIQKELLLLEKHCPWLQALLKIDKAEEVQFVVYQDKRKGYIIQTVPIHKNTFESRKDLPAEWAGKNAEELNSLLNINDAIFAHPARFIAGAKSFESIMKMAKLAIEK